MPPIRPLTNDERLELATSSADAVAIGILEAVRDSIDDEGTLWSWMQFKPLRSIKGDLGTEPLRVYLPNITRYARSRAPVLLAAGPTRCLIFARLVRASSGGFWALVEHPEFPGKGLVHMPTGSVTEAAHDFDRAAARLTPEALTIRSTLVVIGDVYPGAGRVRMPEGTMKCPVIHVDSVLAGSIPAPVESLRAYGLFGAPDIAGKVILMLRPGHDGAYELLGFNSGVLPIRDGKVVGTDDTVPAFVARIRRAAQAEHSRHDRRTRR
jgi:hypothetical protein